MAAASSLKDRPKVERTRWRYSKVIIVRVGLAGLLAAIISGIALVLGVLNDGLSLWDRLFSPKAVPSESGVPALTPVAPAQPEATALPSADPAQPETSALPFADPVQPEATTLPFVAPARPETPAHLAPVATPGVSAPAAPAAPAAPGPVSSPATPPSSRFLTDLPIKVSDGAQPATCTTGGQTFPRSLLLLVPQGDPVIGSYARADYQIPPGLERLTATVGLVDGSPHTASSQVNVFIQSGSTKVYEQKIGYGTAYPISVNVKAGQLLRIQASASGERRACIGYIRLDP